jgi:hypothetical protein
MTKLSFNLSTVELAAQKVDFTVDPAEFSAIALESIFVYGVRRWFQDHINSAAHTFKLAAEDAKAKGELFNDGKPFDVTACYAARLDAAVTGILSAPRSKSGLPALSDFDEALYIAAYDARKNPAFKPIAAVIATAKGLDTAERKAAILYAVAALPEKLSAALRAVAQSKIDQAAILALLTE